MKKIIWTLAAFALLFACEPQETPVDDPTPTPGTEEPGGTDTPGGNDNPAALKVECVTGEATDIDPTSAKLSGTVTIANAKEANGTACFYYSATETEADALAKDGTKADAGAVAADGGSFTVTISDLAPGTEYHFVASVTIDGEEYFGAVKAFTTAEKPKELTVTGAATDVTEWSAILAGYANPTTDMGTVTMGILYSTEENPTLDNGVKLTSTELDDNNMYTVKAKDLASNTTYYYKSTFEYNGVLRSGEVKSFKTKEIDAKTTTLAATEVGLYQATLNGKLEVNSSEELNKNVWFYFSTEEDTVEGLMDKGKILFPSLNDDGSFTYQLSGLTDNTTYYYVAVSKVHDTNFAGEVETFVTTDIDAVVSIETGDADEITLFTATFHGRLTIDSGESFSKGVWFLYSDTENTLEGLISDGEYCDATLQEDGTLYGQKTNLKHSTNYNYVACSWVNNKRYYGEVKTFSTTNLDDLVTISTEDPSDVGCMKATLNGKLVVDSEENLNKNVWFLMSDSENTLEGLKTEGSKDSWISLQEDGTFYKNRSDLKHSSTYYYVACAKVYDKEYYGEVKAINTINLDDIVTLSTEDPSDVGCKNATLNGKLSVESEEYLSKSVWFLMSDSENTLDGLKSAGNTYKGSLRDDGFFYTNCSGFLKHSSTYYYVACAKVDNKEYYGEVKSYNTTNPDEIVTVTTEGTTDLGFSSVTLNGRLEVNTTESLNKKVWFLCSDSETTLDGLKSTGKRVTASVEADGSFSYALRHLSYNTTFFYVAVSKVEDVEFYGAVETFTTQPLPENLVDLGLSVYWGTCNIDASYPYESGGYYAWGETKTKYKYTEDIYTFFSYYNGEFHGITKYCTDSNYGRVDNKTQLEEEDDVAHVKLGGTFRMPTLEEFTELLNNCEVSLMKLNGVKVVKFTSKITGYTDRSIYFPRAGCTVEDSTPIKTGSVYYWSSSLSETPSCARCLYGYEALKDGITFIDFRLPGYTRSMGMPVRPVSD